VSPELAAARLQIPVLLIHGTADTATPPAHSQRVLAALRGPKSLILVDGAGHNQSLGDAKVWQQIDAWMATLMGGP
jgi:pimeloyl-ACP methyl ester carboxylesterase